MTFERGSMLKKLKMRLRTSLLWQRSLFTFVLIMLYMFGRRLPLFTVPLNQEIFARKSVADMMNVLGTVTGGDFSAINLFSLGLSPWMTGMIIWRLFTILKLPFLETMTKTKASTYRTGLTAVVALIQGFGSTASVSFNEVLQFGDSTTTIYRWITVCLLTTGALVMAWAAELNAKKGIGRASIIILVNMLLSFIKNGSDFLLDPTLSQTEFFNRLGGITVIILAVTYVTIVIFWAEYRVPIKRMGVHNTYSEDTYIPIRLMPAGAMPFMYGLSFITLPPLIIRGLQYFYPESSVLAYLANHMTLADWPGIIFYMIILYALSIGFAYMNYDSATIAKEMRKSGDYIEHIRPGKETQRYLQSKIRIFAHIGAWIVCTFAVGPAIIGNLTGLEVLQFLFGNIFIVISFIFMIVEEIRTLLIFKKYHKVL